MADNQARKVTEILVNVTAREAKALALNIHAGVTEQTPVNTGWARANWVPSIGKAQTEPVGDPENVDAAASAVAQGIAEVATWSFDQGPIFIANNVPYIGYLNGGSSKQAPAGFVEKVVQSELDKSNGKKLS